MKLNELKKQFLLPDSKYRSIPFWAWNGNLEKEEIKRQINEMKEAGIGGFFMHSRDGLETEYMSDEWMDLVKTAVWEAKKLGMYAWIYDEDRWPSGTAGGRVTSQGDVYRLKGMTIEVCERSKWNELKEEIQSRKDITDSSLGIQAVYFARIQNMDIITMRKLVDNSNDGPQKGEGILIARLEVSGPSEWFNNEAPPDNLSMECVQSFLDHTHERYKEVIGEEFGKTVLGVFTDEPSLADRHASFPPNRSWIPWTYGYGEYFKEIKGYDFLDVLPYFFFNGSLSAKTRHDYWNVTALRFHEVYFKTIGDWCKENDLAFSGHLLHEDKLGVATRVNGTVMMNYLPMEVPGIDMLCEQTDEYLTVKQCTSVANQFQKPFVITETYGCTGWDFTFEGQKWMGDWQYVLGVNRRCQHLALYSLGGCRKRDYPPSFNYNTSWWKNNEIVEDYFARLGLILEQGNPIRNVVIIHPMSTSWSRLGSSPYGNPIRRNERDVPEINAYGNKLNHLIEKMCRNHYDCDLGDELIIQQFGKVKDGKFIIGNAGYKMVIIPPVDTILPSTYGKIVQYLNDNGKVLIMEPVFSRIDGESISANEIDKLLSHPNCRIIENEEMLWNQMEELYQREISITRDDGSQEKNLLYQLRETDKGFFLFVVNNNREREINATIFFHKRGKVEEWDLIHGTRKDIQSYKHERGVKFYTHFNKVGSRVFFIRKEKKKILPSKLNYELTEENVLTLDFCKYRLNEGEWSNEMEVWQAQYNVREKLAMRQIHRNGIEQRYKWINKAHPQDGNTLELQFEWDSKIRVENSCLVMEEPERFEMYLNDEKIHVSPQGWFLDRAFEKVKIPPIEKGKNKLILRCSYQNDMELENCYLIGMFGVRQDRMICELPSKLDLGDWTKKGLFHYCGNVIYKYNYHYLNCCSDEKNSRVFLSLTEVLAVGIEIIINKNKIKIPWQMDKEIEITNYLNCGSNLIEIEVLGSPRNMLGPLHFVNPSPKNTNDSTFSPDPSKHTKAYHVIPYGLIGKVIISELL